MATSTCIQINAVSLTQIIQLLNWSGIIIQVNGIQKIATLTKSDMNGHFHRQVTDMKQRTSKNPDYECVLREIYINTYSTTSS